MQKINFILIHGWGFADNFWLPLLKCLKNNKKYKLKFNIFNLGFFGEKKIIKTSRKDYINILITHSYGHCWFEKNQFPIDGLISFFYPGNYYFVRRTKKSKLIVNMIKEFRTNPEKVLCRFYKLCGNSTYKSHGKINPGLLLSALKELKNIDFKKIERKYKYTRLFIFSKNDKVLDEMHYQEKKKDHLILDRGCHGLPFTNPMISSKIIFEYIDNEIQRKNYSCI